MKRSTFELGLRVVIASYKVYYRFFSVKKAKNIIGNVCEFQIKVRFEVKCYKLL